MKKIIATTCCSLLSIFLNFSEIKAASEDKQKNEENYFSQFEEKCSKEVERLRRDIHNAVYKDLISSTSSDDLSRELFHASRIKVDGKSSIKKNPTPENFKNFLDQCLSQIHQIKSKYEVAMKQEVAKEGLLLLQKGERKTDHKMRRVE